jgi:hypothetical protein
VLFPGNRSQVVMGSERRAANVKGAERNSFSICRAALLLFPHAKPLRRKEKKERKEEGKRNFFSSFLLCLFPSLRLSGFA